MKIAQRICSAALAFLLVCTTAACATTAPVPASSMPEAPELPASSAPTAEPSEQTAPAPAQTDWREDYAYIMGQQALIYTFPIYKYSMMLNVMMGQGAKVNAYLHEPKLLGPEYQAGTSMNRDTIYSYAFCDLTKEPLVFTIGENTDGRYYSIEFVDAYTDCFGYMGNRTTKNKAAAYLIHAPGWKGEVPAGIDVVLEAPTNWIAGVARTFTNNSEEDLKLAAQAQQGYKVYPASEWGKETPQEATYGGEVPKPYPQDDPLGILKQVNEWMVIAGTPERDKALLQQFGQVGVGPYATKKIDELDEHTKKGLMRATGDGMKLLQKTSFAVGSIYDLNKTVNGWAYNPQNWGRMAETGDFLGRSATQALSGGIENYVEECVKLRTFTDQNGENLNGSNQYKLVFTKDQIPKVEGFWSLTAYNNEYNIEANDQNKYEIRDIDPDLKFAPDGSLTIYLQSTKPEDQNGNWLPVAPDKDFNIFFRAYLPEQAFVDQTYIPPAIERIQ